MAEEALPWRAREPLLPLQLFASQPPCRHPPRTLRCKTDHDRRRIGRRTHCLPSPAVAARALRLPARTAPGRQASSPAAVAAALPYRSCMYQSRRRPVAHPVPCAAPSPAVLLHAAASTLSFVSRCSLAFTAASLCGPAAVPNCCHLAGATFSSLSSPFSGTPCRPTYLPNFSPISTLPAAALVDTDTLHMHAGYPLSLYIDWCL